MGKNNIHISGIGAICSSGNSISESWERLLRGEISIGKLNMFNSLWGGKEFYGGEVALSNNELIELIDKEIISNKFLPTERGELLFFMALIEALKDAGINKEFLKNKKVGIFIGSDTTGITNLEYEYRDYLNEGVAPSLKSQLVFSMQTLLERVAFEYGITGPRFIYSTACSASLHAVIWGSEYLKSKEIDIAIVGGVDPMTSISIAGFSCLKALSKKSCSPFSTTDIGISVGEGAGVLILENTDSFNNRNQSNNYGIIAGYAGTADAYHPTASDPTGRGIKDCINKAIKNCDLSSVDEIFVLAHGTGTSLNDKTETRSLKQAFPDYKKLRVSSIKSMFGHTLGASGAIELAFLAKSFKESKFLPTANFSENRAGCDLTYVKNKPLNSSIKFAIKNSFAFGGNNTSVALTTDPSMINTKKSSQDNIDNEIAIIGVGSITASGVEVETLEIERLKEDTKISKILPITGFYRKNRKIDRVGLVSDELILNQCKKLRIKNHRKMDRISKLATIAAVNAFKDSGLKINSKNSGDIAIVGNTSSGHSESVDLFFKDIAKSGLENGDPNKFPNTVLNAHIGHIAIELKIKGYSTVISQSNSLTAIELAKNILLSGQAETVLVGSSTEYCESLYKGYIDAGVISRDMVPYSKNTKGYIFGEGSAFLVLEKKEIAKKKSRKIYGIIDTVKVGGSPVMPRTNRYKDNLLENLLKDVTIKSDIKSIYGTGSGIKERNRLELETKKRHFNNAELISYSTQVGYIPGVMGILNIATWAKSNYKESIFTEVVEGGMVGVSHIRREDE